jgi:hypothetical protein
VLEADLGEVVDVEVDAEVRSCVVGLVVETGGGVAVVGADEPVWLAGSGGGRNRM